MPSVSAAGTVPDLIGWRRAIDGIALSGPVLAATSSKGPLLVLCLRFTACSKARQSGLETVNGRCPCVLRPHVDIHKPAQQPGHAILCRWHVPTSTATVVYPSSGRQLIAGGPERATGPDSNDSRPFDDPTQPTFVAQTGSMSSLCVL